MVGGVARHGETPCVSLKLLGTVGAAALLAAAVSMPANAAEMANAQLKDASGKAVGDVDLMQTPAGVLIKLQIKGLTPGEHAFHVHAVGKCEAPFESAGPHFNPGNHKHGMMSGEGHAGDMPNLHVPQSGELSVEVVNSAISLEKGKPNSVFDNDGSALVIHAKADDYKTDPAGNAGDRIACGVIQQSGAATVGSAPRAEEVDSARDQHPVIEIEQNGGVVFLAVLVGKIRARPILRRDGAQPQRADVARARAVRSPPAPPTRRTPCRPRTAARRGVRR